MTDFFQGVVAEYLRADRGVFVNPEILLQLEPGASPKKGRFWYCDLMAVSLREKMVYLCEVTYATSASALNKWGQIPINKWGQIPIKRPIRSQKKGDSRRLFCS